MWVILAAAGGWLIGGSGAYALEDSRDPRRVGGSDAALLEPDQRRELEHLIEDLGDPELELDRRRRAAVILIHRGWPAATDELKRRLTDPADPSTRRAIAQAVAEAAEVPSDRLVPPLVGLLDTEDADLRNDVAAALARFDDDGLVRRLIELASDPARPEAARRGAIRALAEHRGLEVVDALLEIAGGEGGDEAEVRGAAFAALARLTGIRDFGEDLSAWRRWWRDARDLPPRQWLTVLMRNLSAHNTALAERLEAMNDRVIAAHHRLYDTAAEEGRPGVLRRMLEDPMVELRLLALELIDRRMLNAQPIRDGVREAMRQRLSDRGTAVRAEAARLLENLADAPATALAADLLPDEADETVQAAYLNLLTRVPRLEAVGPALEMVRRPAVCDAAASFLLAAADEDLLTPDQAAEALRIARSQLASADPSEPALLRLLGRLGGDEDRALILRHLNGEADPVRRAAAEALAGDRWPLDPLLGYIGDEVLGPVVLPAIARRGSSVAALLGLLDHEPAEPQARWREAALAVAGRLDAEGVAAVDEALADQPDRAGLREGILRAAGGLTGGAGATPGGVVESERDRLRRAEACLRLIALYHRADRAAEAAAIRQRLESRADLTEAHRRRLAELARQIEPTAGSGEGG